jgi:hypothetical protein
MLRFEFATWNSLFISRLCTTPYQSPCRTTGDKHHSETPMCASECSDMMTTTSPSVCSHMLASSQSLMGRLVWCLREISARRMLGGCISLPL